MKGYQYLIPYVATFMLSFIVIEIIWSLQKRKKVYSFKESLSNIGILLGMQISRFLIIGWQAFWLFLVYDWTPLRVPESFLAFVLLFILVDFLYYWLHRLMHEKAFLWAFHVVHHSSLNMNFTASFRLNWIAPAGLIFFFLPVVLLGFHPKYFLMSFGFNLLYQFILHTKMIDKVPLVEGIFNTPSAHRVHHGCNEGYRNTNYGGVLIIWDRLFGTYAEETEPVQYGLKRGFISYNPIKLVFHGFIDYYKNRIMMPKQ